MVSGVATGLLVFLPNLSDGGKAISQMVSVMRQANPVASAQAHNLWWIVLKLQGLDPTRTPDSDPTALGVSYLGLSVIAVGVFYVAGTFKLIKERDKLSAEPFAYIGLVFFIAGTRAHENHAIQVLRFSC